MSVPMKLESIPDHHVKMEPPADTPSPYADDLDEVMEEAGDVDFSQVQQQLWLNHIPRSLWEALSQVEDDEEIDLGTIRVEGPEANPKRISLMLNRSLPQLRVHPKEYTLLSPLPEKARSRQPGSAFIFSEKDLPGYKSKTFGWDDVDEEGNPGQGRSYLYEKHKKELRRKENKGRFVPYAKRPIPKQTAIAGTVAREFEVTPVQNDEFFALQDQQARSILKPVEKQEALFAAEDPGRMQGGLLTMSDRAAINKASQNRKQVAKDSRAARIERPQLIDKLLELFKQHRIWGLRDLKSKVQQPESYLRSVLDEIAFMWKHGDFNGKWELKDEYKQQDTQLLNANSVAPKAESDVDQSGMDDDDDEAFEDV